MRSRQLAFDLANAAFDKALLLLGRFVFSVFAQIALSTRFGDGLNHGGALDGLQTLQLGLEFFSSALGDWDGGHGLVSKFSKRRALRGTVGVRFWVTKSSRGRRPKSKPPHVAARRLKFITVDYAVFATVQIR